MAVTSATIVSLQTEQATAPASRQQVVAPVIVPSTGDQATCQQAFKKLFPQQVHATACGFVGMQGRQTCYPYAGKTNTPEFGAGSQTFNNVFGTTLNPWDIRKTAGGSSGGSAAALAVGQVRSSHITQHDRASDWHLCAWVYRQKRQPSLCSKEPFPFCTPAASASTARILHGCMCCSLL